MAMATLLETGGKSGLPTAEMHLLILYQPLLGVRRGFILLNTFC
jgi:hypothetical protein